MHLRRLQAMKGEFARARGWERFPASLVYVHLVEELGEIGRHILFDEGYKVRGMGHELQGGLEREFGQVLSLLLQLANRLGVDLEKAYSAELKLMEKRFPSTEWKRYMRTYGSEATSPAS